ncbi:hypothetical protein PACTADRAFT_41866 [Pachysolen tannophilus NRRL Y-2460]|uniref:Uncharacterized protein n=1 Tax=Pachysolen tannophilus NRRL Y-2460 TaxID=669874 RepID=A0A1E4TWZ7_PACTA|nr:hypothetical protein PACTADRAFT_41866 [Pachysolen tannophilus NRRL Y-2460]
MKPGDGNSSGAVPRPCPDPDSVPDSNPDSVRDPENVVRDNRKLSKQLSKSSEASNINNNIINNKNSNVDSDADSHASRESQETEEDVCFPMIPAHITLKSIDFGEMQQFIKDQREENMISRQREKKLKKTTPFNNYSVTLSFDQPSASSSNKLSGDEKNNNDLEYTHDVGSSSEEGVTFAGNENMSIPPDRFSFFHSESDETIHAPDFPSLVDPGQSVKDLFIKDEGTWWLDCVCPTDAEMKMLAKAFGIHPLTAEDIRMQETREKVELFKSYYFVCFHTFETDNESEDFLEPINVYIVVFRDGVLTFHFSPISHPANVRRRVRQLRDYVNVSSDWLCYALIDDITDGFAPVIQSLEYEADAIEDSVFVAREELDFGAMLRRIGESRRKVMTLMRLLSGKADVIKMFAKRCQDEVPRGDIALYLGDIQDHVLTMFQNLLSYEKIFSRCHSNYLAQLQVESFNANNKATEILSKVTLLGTILIPTNVITGLFGMNVKVPGKDSESFGWFFGILGVLIVFILVCLTLANYYFNLKSKNASSSLLNSMDGSRSTRSFRSFGFRARTSSSNNSGMGANKSIASFTSKTNKSHFD